VIRGVEYSYDYSEPDRKGNSTHAADNVLETIAAGLAAEINTNNQNTGFVASNNSSNQIKLTSLTGAAIDVNKGGGVVNALFDIDYGDIVFGGVTGNILSGNFDYFYRSLYLEVLDSDGNVLGQQGLEARSELYNGLNKPDLGSINTKDPFLNWSFDQAGTYSVRVGSFDDYALSNNKDAVNNIGVPYGMNYQLNISLDGHDVSSKAIDVKNMLVRVIAGAGEGLESVITAYDADTKAFTHAGWGIGVVDNTSRFEIVYDIPSEFALDYSEQTDSYEVVLTKTPAEGETVRVDVTPQATRTYDANLAFSGENDVNRYTAADILLAGDINEEDKWSVILNGFAFAYEATETTDFNEMGLALRDEINTTGNYLASFNDTTSVLSLALNPDSPLEAFTLKTTTPAAGRLTVNNVTIFAVDQVEVGAPNVDLVFTGTPVVGETWVLDLHENDDPYTYQIVGGETVEDLAVVFENAINARNITNSLGYSLTRSGNMLTVQSDINIHLSLAIENLAGNGALSARAYLEFTSLDWDTAQEVTVFATDDNVIDGGDSKVFASIDERINRIRGPLTIDGGLRASQDIYLNNPFTLPDETNWKTMNGLVTSATTVNGKATLTDSDISYFDAVDGQKVGFDQRMNASPYSFTILTGDARGTVMEVDSVVGTTVTFMTDWPDGFAPESGDEYAYDPVNLNVTVIESDQVDNLNIFNASSPVNDQGVLTEDSLTGLGMGGDITISGVEVPGGIRYYNLENLNLELGQGNDVLEIESTHLGNTMITSADGEDRIDVRTVAGHTVIDTGEQVDIINVGSHDQQVDQIMALLTLIGGEGDDILNVIDSGDQNNNQGNLTADAITGLDMPTVREAQQLYVRAAGGTYQLRINDLGIGSGLLDSANVTRHESYALVSLSYDMSATDMQLRLEELYGVADIQVTRSDLYYTITFAGDNSGLDFAELVWNETRETTGLIPAVDESVDVRVETLRNGTTSPVLGNFQVLTLNATEGSFVLSLLGQNTAAIAYNASAEEIVDALQPILNPNNTDSAKPYTRNVSVIKLAERYLIQFQGEHQAIELSAEDINTSDLTGTASIETRLQGINYYDIETLNINLGEGNDDFNIQSTNADVTTNLYTGVGADAVYVASDAISDFTLSQSAHGTLDGINGELNIDAGGDNNALYISDFDSLNEDTSVLITDNSISGLSVGVINYTATNGNFDNDFVIWAGQGSDVIDVTSVYEQGVSITTLFTNEGHDRVTVSAVDDLLNPNHIPLELLQRRLDIFSQSGMDTINASTASLAVRVDGGDDKDFITGGLGDDVLLGNAGDDEISGRQGEDYIDGQADHDTIFGDQGDDQLFGGEGNDLIRGLSGNDHINGGLGHDILFGEDGEVVDANGVRMLAEELRDITGMIQIARISSVSGSTDDDVLTDMFGNNIVMAGLGDDRVFTGDGDDWIFGDTGEIQFEAGLVSTMRTNNDGSGDDYIESGAGDDIVFGGLGHDTIYSERDNDIVIADTGSIEKNTSANLISLIKNDLDPILGGNDIVYLGEGNDVALGGAGLDSIYGEEGKDALFGDFVEIKEFSDGMRDIQSILPTFGANDLLDGGAGFDMLVGGHGYDEFNGSLTEDIIVGNYARIQDAADFRSLLVVSDPTGREIISASMFDIYRTDESIFFLDDGQQTILFSDEGYSEEVPLRTDTALRLTPLLNGEELSRLSDSELKDFLRNLPLIQKTHRSAPQPNNAPKAPGENLDESFDLAYESYAYSALAAVDRAILRADEEHDSLQANNKLASTDMEAEDTAIYVDEPQSMVDGLSGTLAASLMFVANAGRKRGWNTVRLSSEESQIQGDLNDLRKQQDSQQFTIWEKPDGTSEQ